MTDMLGRLLLVDDEAPVLDVLSEYFTTQGYAVETASNGPDALSAARHHRPDLVLLDIRMPGMDGVEVLKKIRDIDPTLAVIMVTANEDMALARETLKSGAFDYVAKPFDFRYLDRAVSAALVHSTVTGPQAPTASPSGSTPAEDLQRLVSRIFKTVRAMPAGGRESTGTRLETAALDALREFNAGRWPAAASALTEIEVLIPIAADLGDVGAADRAGLESALAGARKAAAHG